METQVIVISNSMIVCFGIGLLIGTVVTGLIIGALIPSMVEGAFKKLRK